jgi:hypothetical protein
MAQLAEFQKSDFSTKILEIAAGYQSKASDHRLGLPRTQNASLKKATAASTSCFKKAAAGVSKGKTLLTEIQEKRANTGKVKITAGLWMMMPGKKGGAGNFVWVSTLGGG